MILKCATEVQEYAGFHANQSAMISSILLVKCLLISFLHLLALICTLGASICSSSKGRTSTSPVHGSNRTLSPRDFNDNFTAGLHWFWSSFYDLRRKSAPVSNTLDKKTKTEIHLVKMDGVQNFCWLSTQEIFGIYLYVFHINMLL